MKLFDIFKPSIVKCTQCRARIVTMSRNSRIGEIEAGAKNGTLPHQCGSCKQYFCLRCIVSAPAGGEDPTIFQVMGGSARFKCPLCGSENVRVTYAKK